MHDGFKSLHHDGVELHALYDRLAEQLETIHRSDQATIGARDQIHEKILIAIHEIAKRAIQIGRAEEFVP